jgi:hypothetical protein
VIHAKGIEKGATKMMGRLLNQFAGRKGLSIIVSLVLLCCQIDAFSSPQSIANRHAAATFSTISPRGHVFSQPAGPIRKTISISAHDMGREESDVSIRRQESRCRQFARSKIAFSLVDIFSGETMDTTRGQGVQESSVKNEHIHA